ncbi:MAG: hypothetical protein U5N56_11995 [Candidatus Marinimicrobia bacterium]|nr:hypothetical protein [Candidatus Neomarinimicrobiota bacterium]
MSSISAAVPGSFHLPHGNWVRPGCSSLDNDPEIENNFRENIAYNKLDKIDLEISDVLGIDDYSCDLAVINIQKNIILPL